MKEILQFENPSYPNSIIGKTNDGRLIYCLELMIMDLTRDKEMTEEDAIEFIEYNTIRSLPYYKGSPIVVSDPYYLIIDDGDSDYE